MVRWDSKKKNDKLASVDLAQCSVIGGLQEGLFKRRRNKNAFKDSAGLCFSIVAPDRTLDLVAPSQEVFQMWKLVFTEAIPADRRVL